MQEPRVLIMGEPSLMVPSQNITDFTSAELSELIEMLIHTKNQKGGVGIAAPQIGISKRVIVYGFDHNPRYPNEKPIPLTILVNPFYTIVDDKLESAWEGCLSVPKLRGKVPRFRTISLNAYDREGRKIERIVTGFEARALQHEIDHLDGILYPMRMTDFTQFGYEEVLWPALYGAEYPLQKLFS